MLGLSDFEDKSPLSFLKIMKLPSFYSGNFKTFKNALGHFISNCPPKRVITSTGCLVGEAETADKGLTLDNRIYVIARDLLR